jgi:hypothetical protein
MLYNMILNFEYTVILYKVVFIKNDHQHLLLELMVYF